MDELFSIWMAFEWWLRICGGSCNQIQFILRKDKRFPFLRNSIGTLHKILLISLTNKQMFGLWCKTKRKKINSFCALCIPWNSINIINCFNWNLCASCFNHSDIPWCVFVNLWFLGYTQIRLHFRAHNDIRHSYKEKIQVHAHRDVKCNTHIKD